MSAQLLFSLTMGPPGSALREFTARPTWGLGAPRGEEKGGRLSEQASQRVKTEAYD